MTQRTILFRGRDIEGNWHEGDLWSMPDNGFAIVTDGNQWCESKDFNPIPVDHATVGQFTGLTDKNGVKIFEGDIVFRSGHDVKSTIEWVEKYMCFAGKIDGTLYGFYQQIDMPYIEVIGTIHTK